MKDNFNYTKYTLNNRLMKEEGEVAQSFPRAELEDAVHAAIQAGLSRQEILDIVRMATGNMQGPAIQ